MIDIGTKVWINGSVKEDHYEVLGITEAGFYILDRVTYAAESMGPSAYVRRHNSPFVYCGKEEVMVVDNG